MLLKDSLKEIVDLLNKARVGSRPPIRTVDGIRGCGIQSRAEINNLIEACPFHHLRLQIHPSQSIFCVDVQAAKEVQSVMLAINRAARQQKNARRLFQRLFQNGFHESLACMELIANIFNVLNFVDN